MPDLTLKDTLKDVVITRGGKPVTDCSAADTFIVRPVADGPFCKAAGAAVLAPLREANPKAVFVWVATPAAKPKSESK